MKKAVVFVLIALCILSAAGCKKTKAEFRADVFWYTFADTFLANVRNTMTEELRAAGIKFQHHDSNNNQNTQTQMIQTAINRGTDVLIVNIVTTGSDDAAMNIANMAKDAGIPLIWFNREVSDTIIETYPNSVFVGTDAYEAGIMQGQAIAKFLLKEEHWNGPVSKFDVNKDGKINYLMFRTVSLLSLCRYYATKLISLFPFSKPLF